MTTSKLIFAIAAGIILAVVVMAAGWRVYENAKAAHAWAEMARESDEIHERIMSMSGRLEPGAKVVAQSHFGGDGKFELYEVRAATEPDNVPMVSGLAAPDPDARYAWFHVKHHAPGTVVEDPGAGDDLFPSSRRSVKVEFARSDLTRHRADFGNPDLPTQSVWVQRCDLAPVR